MGSHGPEAGFLLRWKGLPLRCELDGISTEPDTWKGL
jgi:hypothetical protein